MSKYVRTRWYHRLMWLAIAGAIIAVAVLCGCHVTVTHRIDVEPEQLWPTYSIPGGPTW